MPDYFDITVKPQSPKQIIEILQNGSDKLNQYFGEEIYINKDPEYLKNQRERLIETLQIHEQRVGDKPTYLLRAPGRLNAFLEYLDMCSGDHMSTTIDGDIPVAFSPRNDTIISAMNANPLFPQTDISITEAFEQFAGAPWKNQTEGMADNWDNRSFIQPHAGRPAGNWLNFVLCPYLRVMWDYKDIEICGADITFGKATAPFRAGTSSSSAIVVLSFLTMYLTNRRKLPQWRIQEVCRLLGEAEWYVGTHGGANDQTTILRNPPNSVVYNRHSHAELESTPLPFLKGIHVVLANSLWEVNKTTVGNQSFNMRKGWMQMGDEVLRLILTAATQEINSCNELKEGWLIKLIYEKFGFIAGAPPKILETTPEYWNIIAKNYNKFGSLCEDILGIPDEAINELVYLLPVKITPAEAGTILGKDKETIERIYTKPKRDIGGYHLRTTARFFHKENQIGRTLERIFLTADNRLRNGEITEDDPEYDGYRIKVGQLVDELQDALCFDFRVSIPQLDLLLTIARRGPGYLGGKLTGAGKGGCVSILVRAEDSDIMCEYLDKEYYSKPERFEFYRMVLKDDLRNGAPGSPEHESAQERLTILENALKNITEQRRVITFSRGACALDFDNLA